MALVFTFVYLDACCLQRHDPRVVEPKGVQRGSGHFGDVPTASTCASTSAIVHTLGVALVLHASSLTPLCDVP